MTAEELLMMSDDIETYSVDDSLVIDPESRVILTPVGGLVLGVESDQDSERVYFACPRFVGDNIDLSSLQLRVIYRNAKGEKDFRICTDVKVDGDKVRFSWLLSRKVTRYKGKVNFIVCAIRTQADGTIKNEWNTTLAEGIALEGLEIDIQEEEFEEPKDIVLQLLEMLNQKEAELLEEVENLRTDVKADIEATKQSAMDEVEAKGKATLETIPEDYIFVSNLAKENRQLKANSIKSTYAGETIVATDSAEAKFEGLRVFGRSEQPSTTGKNKFDIEGWLKGLGFVYSKTGNVITVEINGNPNIYGLTTFENAYKFSDTDVEATVSFKSLQGLVSDNKPTIQIFNSSGTKVASVSYGENKSVTATGCRVGILYNTMSLTGSGVTFDSVQIELGSSATEYEPYTGGKPSPSPEYPQPFESVGDDGSIDVGVYGKNLISYPYNVTTSEKNGIIFTDNGDGTITLNGTATSNTAFKLKDYTFKKGNTYTLSGCHTSGGVNKYLLHAQDPITFDGGNGATFSFDEDATKTIQCLVYSGVTINNLTFKPQLEISDIATEYEPYRPKQSLSIPTPNGLPGIKVTDASLATYTDAEGVMWCADEIDFARGKYVQRIARINKDNLVVKRFGTSSNGTPYVDITANGSVRDGIYMSNMYRFVPINSTATSGIAVSYKNEISLFDERFTSVSQATELLKSDGFELIYISPEPIETDLTAEQLEAYKALHTNYPTTTILNDDNAYMEAVLVADTKNHIEQNYVPVTSYNSLVERVSTLEQRALA